MRLYIYPKILLFRRDDSRCIQDSMKPSKKAQMEMIGLAVVVILVALGMFLLVRFAITEKPSEVKKTFTSKELATNMIKTMLDSDSDCDNRNLIMNELVRAYAEQETFTCHGKDIKTYIEESAGYIFNNTLEKWKVDYSFEIDVPNGEGICLAKIRNSRCGACPCTQKCLTKVADIFPLPSAYGNIAVKLDICT